MAAAKERVPGAKSANILGALCYIPIFGTALGIVILVTNMRRNKYMEYHAWQGGVFSVLALFVLYIVWPIIGWPGGLLMQGLGFHPFDWLWHLIAILLWLGWLCLTLWYIYLALLNEYFEVPVVLSIVEPFMIYQSEEAAEETSEEAPAEDRAEGGDEAGGE